MPVLCECISVIIKRLSIKQYGGEFEVGQYRAQGTLIDRDGEVYEGEFKGNCYLGTGTKRDH